MPSLSDFQSTLGGGFYVPEAFSGINGVAVDTIGNVVTLNAVGTSAGVVTANALNPQAFRVFTVQLRTTGTFTTGKMLVEGSIDGTNWTEVQISNATTGNAVATGGFTFTTAAVSLFCTTLASMPLRYIRPRLTNGTGGGTAAFVSVFVAGE